MYGSPVMFPAATSACKEAFTHPGAAVRAAASTNSASTRGTTGPTVFTSTTLSRYGTGQYDFVRSSIHMLRINASRYETEDWVKFQFLSDEMLRVENYE